MIRSDALMGMLRAETAAAAWFDKMSKEEQQAYLRAHPRSKMGSGGGGGARPRGGKPIGGTIKMVSDTGAHEEARRAFARHGSKIKIVKGDGGDHSEDEYHIPWNADNAHRVHKEIQRQWDVGLDGDEAHDELKLSSTNPKSLDALRKHVQSTPKPPRRPAAPKPASTSTRKMADGSYERPYKGMKHFVRSHFPGHYVDDNEIVHKKTGRVSATIHPNMESFNGVDIHHAGGRKEEDVKVLGSGHSWSPRIREKRTAALKAGTLSHDY